MALEPEETLHEEPHFQEFADESEQGTKGDFVDDVSGCILDRQMVVAARQEELREVDRFKCYEWVPIEESVK
eukprot:2744584-Prorocentrum_lima.AAC.1